MATTRRAGKLERRGSMQEAKQTEERLDIEESRKEEGLKTWLMQMIPNMIQEAIKPLKEILVENSKGIQGLDQEIQEIKKMQIDMQQELTDVKRAQQNITSAFENLSNEVQQIREKVTDLEDNEYQLKDFIAMEELKQKEHSLRVRSLKESQGEDIRQIIIEALAPVLELTNAETDRELDRIFRINSYLAKNKNLPRDVIINFSRKITRDKVLEAHYKNKTTIKGQQVELMKEIPSRLLKRRKDYAFLTVELKKRGAPFRWLLPEGIALTHNEQRITLNTVAKARNFYREILQQTAEARSHNKGRRPVKRQQQGRHQERSNNSDQLPTHSLDREQGGTSVQEEYKSDIEDSQSTSVSEDEEQPEGQEQEEEISPS